MSACGTKLEELVIRVHSDAADRTLVSKVSRKLATARDPVLGQIPADAAEHLIAMARSLRSTLGDLPVAMVGEVLDIPSVAQAFVAATGAAKPLEAPEFGAVRLANGHAPAAAFPARA